jgi:hypothetical protein
MAKYHLPTARRRTGRTSLLDLVWSRQSSVRLRNALGRGDKEGALPFSTVTDYVRAGPSAPGLLRRYVRNFGIGCANELDALVREFLDEGEVRFLALTRPAPFLHENGQCVGAWRLNPEEQARRDALLADLKSLTLVQAVDGKTVSLRLAKAIAQSGIGALTAIDLLCGGRFAQTKLLRIRNFGRSTLDELIELCREAIIRRLASGRASRQIFERNVALVLDYDPEIGEEIASATPVEPEAAPQPPPAGATLEALLGWGLAVLPEQQRAVLARRYGWPNGESETLLAIGSDWGLTRERIRQLEDKALRKLRECLPTAAIDEALGAEAVAYWVSRPEPFVAADKRANQSHLRRTLLRWTLPGGVRLALDIRGTSVGSWLAVIGISMRNVYLAPGEDVGRIRALAAEMRRAAASGPLPLPLERLELAAEPWQWRVAELETGLLVAQGFLLRNEPSARVRRAMRLYRLLEDEGIASTAALHGVYRAHHRDDPCSARDIGIVLHDYPHLFRRDGHAVGARSATASPATPRPSASSR